jgi:Signal transduction histidine kinase
VKNRLLGLIILFIVLQCSYTKAFDETIKIDNYSYKDGLTTSTLVYSYKDSRGFLWLCSTNGLFRFDGYSFRNINTLTNDFQNCGTLCVTEDNEQNLWIGTSGKGLIFYDTHTEKLISVRLSSDNNIKVNSILFYGNKIILATNIGLVIANKPQKVNNKDILQAQVLLPFPLYRNSQDNVINQLYAAPGSDMVWVGTNGALYVLNSENLSLSRIESYFQNSIRSLSGYLDKIVVGSWDGGIFAVNPKTAKLDNDDYIRNINTVVGDKRVKTVLFDNQNRCWVATFGFGLFVFEKTTGGNVTYTNYRNDEKQQEYLKSDFINQMYLDNSGIIWLSMNQPALSKVYFQKSSINYYNFLKNNNNDKFKEILTVYPSVDRQKVWVTTNGSGIYLFDISTNSYKQFNSSSPELQLQNNDISFCYQDKTGNLWIVYRRIGLYVVPANAAKKLIGGGSHPTCKPIDANPLVSYNMIANSYITMFYADSQNRLWIGAWGSLYIINFDRDFENARNTTELVSQSKTNCIYLDQDQTHIHFPISPVLTIAEMEKHKFLVGTMDAGIIEFTETSPNRFDGKLLDISQKLPSSNINHIFRDSRQNIWIATISGLCCWNPKTNSFRVVGIKDGIASEIIYNILEDKRQNIWVSTSYGISKINTNDFTVSNFFYTEREKINQYIPNAAALISNGTVCFSTNEALAAIDPATTENSRHYAPIYFTDIKIDNKTVVPLEKYSGTRVLESGINESKTITVPYNHTLRLEFAALSYSDPERVTYKYRMGDNSEWIILNSNQRSLSLPNMKSGKYKLHIMLANCTYDKQGRSVVIIYLPPFWQSKPAFVIYFALLLLIFLIYRRLTIQRVIQQSIIEKERYERKKLQELDKMKTEFFSNISHEFRTPLSLIINPLEKLAKDGELTSKNKEKVNLILKSSNRLLKLVNELMDFSKIEKQLMIPEFQLNDIVSFTREVCGVFGNMADSMNIDFRLNSAIESMYIPMDKRMIEKVMYNLLSNAFKFTPSHGVIMVGLAKQTLDDLEYVKISVINTGEGIAAENLTKVFDRYYQVNNVQNRNMEGTGIGLSLVKSFVELHHGKVEVKSERNLETSFEVYLPANQEVFQTNTEVLQANTLPDNDVEISPELSAKMQSQYSVLLVEDEEDIRQYIVDELSADFKISTARNGAEGIELATDLIPDLIITDVMMPEVSGIELCKTLKNQIITSHIPIIILSAKTTVNEQIEGLEMGADVYMIKPFSMEHLKTQIIRLIHFKESVYSRYLNGTTLIPQGGTTTSLDEEFMKKIIDFIEKHLTNTDLNVDQLAASVSLSKVQTYRKIKAISGQSIVEFIRTVRLKKAAGLISERNLSFAEIAYETGFSSPSYFTKCFHDHFGKTPSEYAEQNQSRS